MASVDRFEDLVAWQLSEQLKEEILKITARENVKRDFDFCDDIQRSARSAPANISEGFGYYTPKQNARHVVIARASLQETLNHLLEAGKRGYIDKNERAALLSLNRRALGASGRYLQYLKSCKSAPPGWSKDKNRNTEPENQTTRGPKPENQRAENPRTNLRTAENLRTKPENPRTRGTKPENPRT